MRVDKNIHIVYDVFVMIRAQILFTPSLYDQLRYEAEVTEKSISELVREAVSKLFLKKKKNGGEVLREMLKDAGPGNKNTPRDLGSNDEYLYGINSPDNR